MLKRDITSTPKYKVLLGAGYILISLTIMHYPMWIKGHTLGWDAMRESWGDLSYTIRALNNGIFPFWNHLERGGYPFFADPQTAVLYPFHWPLYLLGGLFGTGPWLAVARAMIHYFIAAVGCQILALSWRVSHSLSVLFALCYTLSGRLLKSKDNAGLWTMVWLPWLMWSVQQLIAKPSYHRAIILTGILTCNFYAGYPPNFARSLFFLGIWAMYQIVISLKKDQHISLKNYISRLSLWTGFSAVLTTIFCAPGIMSTLQVLKQSERSQLGLTQLLTSRFQLADTFDLIIPRAIHTKSYALIYIGLVGTGLAIHYVFSKQVPFRDRLFWFCMACLSLLWTCGGNTPVLKFFIKYIPSFNLWRIAEQYAFLFVFSLCIMILKAGQSLERSSDLIRAELFLQLAKIFSVLTCIIVGVKGLKTIPNSSGYYGLSPSIIISFILSIYFWFCVKFSQKNTTQVWIFLILLTTLDIALNQQPLVNISQRIPQITRDRLVHPTSTYLRFADHQYLRWRPAARLGQPDLIGRYSTMVSKRWQRYSQMCKKHKNLYAWGSVKQVFNRSHRPQVINSTGPYAFWTPTYRYMKSPRQVLNSMTQHHPMNGLIAFGESKELALIHKSLSTSSIDDSQKHESKVKVLHIGWGEIELEVKAPADGYLVINESYSPWWFAKIDQEPAIKTHRINYLFQGIFVSTGIHHITLFYYEKYTVLALWIALLTMIALGIYQLNMVKVPLRQRNTST